MSDKVQSSAGVNSKPSGRSVAETIDRLTQLMEELDLIRFDGQVVCGDQAA